ncbi:MAG: pilin [bacterium]|nr:pilin [bacterium]
MNQLVQATEYKLLAPLPNYVPDVTTAGPYIEGIFILIIAIATGLAVIKIIFGGIKYMSTDAFGGKSEAKGTIENAIWGLLLAISAWLILYTVNPNLVKFNLKIPVQKISEKPPAGGGGLNDLSLTQQQASSVFRSAGVVVAGPINLAGIRQGTVDEVVRLKQTCSNCNVVVTSATGGEHASGMCSHANGYKVDLRSQGQGTTLTNYIERNYQQLPNRSDGAKIYRSSTGALYALEGNHWDMAKC